MKKLPPELKPYLNREGVWETWLHEQCWDTGVIVLSPCSLEQEAAFLLRRFNVELDERSKGFFFAGTIEARTSDGSMWQIVTIREWRGCNISDITLLSHELFHVTENILTSKGLPHSPETSEAWAYLHDSLLRRFLIAIPKKAVARKRKKS